MNKFTTTLAGLALVAGASIAPAFAQGNFSTPGPFLFTFIGTPGTAGSSFLIDAIPVSYAAFGTSVVTTGNLTLFGGSEIDGGPLYSGVKLSFVPTGGTTATVTDSFAYTIEGNTVADGYGFANFNKGVDGSNFNLLQGHTAPAVPEASTVISFGALLALGGLAVLRRKSVAKNAA